MSQLLAGDGQGIVQEMSRRGVAGLESAAVFEPKRGIVGPPMQEEIEPASGRRGGFGWDRSDNRGHGGLIGDFGAESSLLGPITILHPLCAFVPMNSGTEGQAHADGAADV